MAQPHRKNRCYFECLRDGPLHTFPKKADGERYLKWKEVLDKPTQEKGFTYIFNNIRLCYRHFEKCYRLPSRHLTQNAVPTINLMPGSEQTEVYTVPSTNPGPKILNFTMPDNEICNLGNGRLKAIPKEDIKVAPPLRKPPEPQKNDSDKFSGLPKKPDTTSSVSVSQESTTSTVAEINAKLHGQYLEIKKLKKKIVKLNNRNERQQNLIKELRKTRLSKMINKYLSKLPEPIRTFTKLQLKFKKKPRGRRFTTEEKEMALEIFKKSISSYIVLKQMFVLPSIRSLRNFIAEKCIKSSEGVWILEVGPQFCSQEVTVSSE